MEVSPDTVLNKWRLFSAFCPLKPSTGDVSKVKRGNEPTVSPIPWNQKTGRGEKPRQ